LTSAARAFDLRAIVPGVDACVIEKKLRCIDTTDAPWILSRSSLEAVVAACP
jgi:hypothetical protein